MEKLLQIRQTPLDRFTQLQGEISDLLGKRRAEGRSLDPSDFPTTEEERKAWANVTAPENLEIMIELNAVAPPINEQSLKLWDRALDECRKNTLHRLAQVPLSIASNLSRIRECGAYHANNVNCGISRDEIRILIGQTLAEVGLEVTEENISVLEEVIRDVNESERLDRSESTHGA
jgi:hypothetical protein